ncbi:phosphatidate cytidylyltransferase [Candidatus Ruminimicrobiellum ovillum]|uniref:phosphatidate cytidylyltransferase n=1 Tax=Candidatus Ruminimicrobiellum ovillum TaxID=1947927 RepID=UPI00355A0D1E
MLIPRILTALVGIPVVIACIYYGGLAFYIMFFAVILFSVMEFFSICKKYNPLRFFGTLAAIVFYLALCTGTYVQETVIVSVFLIFFFAMFRKSIENVSASLAVTALGTFFITWALFHMVLIRDIPKYGIHYIIFLFVNIWMLDTGAYFIGKKFGKHKLASLISPKKTIEGAIAGVVTAVLVSLVYRHFFMQNIITNNEAIIFALVISFVGQFSDLAESLFKRDCNIKDSGNILPGHGGMLDRFDSYLFCAPIFYYLIQLMKY